MIDEKPKTGRLTMSVPEAGDLLGIGRNQAYEAARRGDIPVIRIGKRLLVPVRALERMLDGVKPTNEGGSEPEAQ